jgi:hypothetical protein
VLVVGVAVTRSRYDPGEIVGQACESLERLLTLTLESLGVLSHPPILAASVSISPRP